MLASAKWKKKIQKKPIQFVRGIVQLGFLIFLLYIGWKFYLFYQHFATLGVEPFVERPSAVEGFLPISALVAFKVWVTTGKFDQVHPAGLALFSFIVISGILFRKSFCSWMCPVGTVSEWTGRLGKKIFKRNFDLPRWVTWFLYPLKYLLLLFFAKMIIFDMPVVAAQGFLESPYNKISDAKMMLFFLEISQFSLKVILIIFVLSLFIKNFWCRFLCPYGALIGISGLFGITKVTRNEETCIDCQQCTKVCPQRIKVSKKKQILTPECTACMQCIEACPVKDTLNMKAVGKRVNKWAIPIAFFSLFILTIIVAKATGNWDTSITYQEFQNLFYYLDYIGH